MSEHDGHRHRIIEKLDSGSLREHELLEILLFNAIPRRNTNDIAHRLLSAFGSIKGVFSATLVQLTSVKGVGESVAAYLICIGKFYEKYRDDGEETFPRKYDPNTFTEHISERYSRFDKEVLDFYLLDKRDRIIFYKSFTTDSTEQVVVNPNELTRILDVCTPYGLIVVHNHLKGSCLPSEADNKDDQSDSGDLQHSERAFLRSFHLFSHGDIQLLSKRKNAEDQ